MKTSKMNKHDFFELATKILSGQGTSEDKTLHIFLLKNEEYRKFFLWYQSKWNAEETVFGKDYNYLRGLELLRTKITESENKITRIPSIKSRLDRRIIQIAASIIIIIGLGYLSYNITKKESGETQNIAFVTKSTKRGERTKIELPDGSIVHLNSESNITYPEIFNKKLRKIQLEGEAFFEVVSDEKRPFIVHSGEITTTVLGTKFNVSNRSNNVYVTLESGKVKVSQSNSEKEFFLIPGDQFSYDITTGITRKTKVKTSLFTDWRNGTLQFNEINFAEAIKKIENWYNIEIECNSEDLLKRNIRGKYDNEELKTVLEDLEFMFDFKYEFVNDSAIIIYK